MSQRSSRGFGLRAPGFGGVGAALAVWLAAGDAWAQVNWDAGLEAGAMKRFTTSSQTSQPGFGPAFELQGHVALIPMLRVGLYAAQDISPMPGWPARQFYEGGLHVKVTPPLLSSPWRTYLFTGFGAAYVHQAPRDGTLLEVPAGLGLALKVRAPWEVFAELGGRVGVAFLGDVYGDGITGKDSFAVSLSVGVSLSD
ncbi:MAG TPA: hypothetical protein VF765_10415 [Polyangiaceae bacterium]